MSDEEANPVAPVVPLPGETPPVPAESAAQAATVPPPNPVSLSTLARPLADMPAIPISLTPIPTVRYRRVLGRLTKIEIENYRAFRGHFELDLPDGCNLLVYGENGAGKSSFYNALKDFFENPERLLKIEKNRHAFNTDPPLIRLSFAAPSPAGGDAIISKSYEWSGTKNDSRAPEMRTVDKAKGFLDYRALLRIHLLSTDEEQINLFDLFINPLLAQYKNPVTGQTFEADWRKIKGPFAPYRWKPSALDDWIRDFNAGFERVVKDSVNLASKILADFDKELAVEVKYENANYIWRPKGLFPPSIMLKPSFKHLVREDYQNFLNEARLSAIATAIYFSGLKQSPVATFGLLVLDDILIGLDMANRMMVLDIIEKLFKDWQIIILTYHKAWFEVLKAHLITSQWTNDWKVVTMRMRRAMGTEFPIDVTKSETFLSQANIHFDPPPPSSADIKAAAVYARTAFEAVMSWYCAEMKLSVTYAESRRELDTNDFLESIEKQLSLLRDRQDREFARGVLQELKHARRFVLNPHSHYNPEQEDEIAAEIANGIKAVEDFDFLLRCVTRNDFTGPEEQLEEPQVSELISHSLERLGAGFYSAALDALARAFALHLDEWFRLRGEHVPYGVSFTPARLLALAGQKHMVSSRTWLLLKHSKDYLLGEVHPKQFNRMDFERATRLFLKLRLLFILGKEP
jgi:hypothetical protein